MSKEKELTGVWVMLLKSGKELQIQHGRLELNPLSTEPEFDKGQFWSIDAYGEKDTGFKPDPEENSFILVPKSEVEKVYFEPYGKKYHAPIAIKGDFRGATFMQNLKKKLSEGQ